MSSLVSVRLGDSLLRAMKANASRLQLSQTDYIRQSIAQMNHEVEVKARQKRLKNASLRVRQESKQVNAEFSRIEYDPET